MKKVNNQYIDKLVKKFINENINDKADEIMSQINELGGMDDGHPRFGKINLAKMTDKEIEALLKQPMDDIEIEYDNEEEDDLNEEPLYEIEMGDSEVCECGSNTMVSEGMCMECGLPKMDEGIDDYAEPFGDEEQSFDYIEEEDDVLDFDFEEEKDDEKDEENSEFCRYQKRMFGPQDERYREKCTGKSAMKDLASMKMNMNEKLHGRQKNIDKNHNGRIDAEDFKMLRKGSKRHMDETDMDEGNAFTGALANAKKHHRDEFEVDGKKYHVNENKKGVCDKCGMKNCKCNHKKEMSEKWKGNVDVKQTGEYSDMSIEELNAAIKKQKAKNDKTQESGKKVSHADKTKMSQLYFAKRAKQGWKGEGKAKVKESVKLTESELVNLIENLISEKESKGLKALAKPKGMSEYERAFKGSGKENKDAMSDTNKKMKEYVKYGSEGEYDANPKDFPMSNGQIKHKKIKGFNMDNEGQEFIDDYLRPGQENISYDEIHPNEEWMEKIIGGSSKTGNSDEYANSVKTDVNKKLVKKQKAHKLDILSKKAANKAPQPIFTTKDKSAGYSDGDGVRVTNESSNTKEEKILNEEFNRISELMKYNRSTQ